MDDDGMHLHVESLVTRNRRLEFRKVNCRHEKFYDICRLLCNQLGIRLDFNTDSKPIR